MNSFWLIVPKVCTQHGEKIKQQVVGKVERAQRCKVASLNTSIQQRAATEVEQDYKFSKPTTRDVLPLARIHLLIFLKLCHQLGTMYSNL